MYSKNMLILTGAGFGTNIGLPLENDVMKIGLKLCKENKPELIDGIKSSWNLIDPNTSFTKYSFEELLTKIVFAEQYTTYNKSKELEIHHLKLAIFEVLVQALKKPLKKEIPRIYIEFIKLYKDKAHFVTLNYDYLIELILMSEKIPWNYGYNFDEINISSFHNNHYMKRESADFPTVFKYLKLHGSFNWHFCWKCGLLRLSDFKYFGTSGEIFSKTDRFSQVCMRCMNESGQPVMQPLIIPPSAIKYYNTPIFLELWYEFEKLIKEIEKLIIIGCSIRDDDTFLIYILNNLSIKNPRLKKIVVINPDEKVDIKIENITKHSVIRYNKLEDYILMHD